MKLKNIFRLLTRSPPLSQEQHQQRMDKQCESVEGKIKALEEVLTKCKKQLKRTRTGSSQEAIKARATRILKQKKLYEGQRDMLLAKSNSQLMLTYKRLENGEVNQELDELDSEDKMEEESVLCKGIYKKSTHLSYNIPNDLNEEEILAELMALEAEMSILLQTDAIPPYLHLS